MANWSAKNLYIRSDQKETYRLAEAWCLRNNSSLSILVYQLLTDFLGSQDEQPPAVPDAMLEDFAERIFKVEAQVKEALWRLGIGPSKLMDCRMCGEAHYAPLCADLKVGLCGNRERHAPHRHDSNTLGPFWCSADESTRLPYAAEVRREKSGQAKPAEAPGSFICPGCGTPAVITTKEGQV